MRGPTKFNEFAFGVYSDSYTSVPVSFYLTPKLSVAQIKICQCLKKLTYDTKHWYRSVKLFIIFK